MIGRAPPSRLDEPPSSPRRPRDPRVGRDHVRGVGASARASARASEVDSGCLLFGVDVGVCVFRGRIRFEGGVVCIEGVLRYPCWRADGLLTAISFDISVMFESLSAVYFVHKGARELSYSFMDYF